MHFTDEMLIIVLTRKTETSVETPEMDWVCLFDMRARAPASPNQLAIKIMYISNFCFLSLALVSDYDK